MSPLPTYTFFPWLREGVANNITSADLDSNVKVRASVQVDLHLNADKLDGGTQTETITRPVSLYGPGDIVGIETRAIIRTEPRNWITNFEPNYLACIEFYDEDFPWRYTPAAPGNHRLRPWIVLVVLKEGEFEEGRNIQGRPLPFISVPDASVFPAAEQLWAWAHVHINRGLTASDTEITSNDMGAVLPKLQATLNEDPDLGYSRIVCPRKLEENAAYHAFLLPVFESGRLAGLGLDPNETPHATFSAWADYPSGTRQEPANYPVYFRWFFRTGTKGDFEYLVRLLEPKPVDPRVGRRDMDVLRPGANLPGITDPELKGVLRLGGALSVPRILLNEDELAEADMYDQWDQPRPHVFQERLAAFIDLADDYQALAAGDANTDSGFDGVFEDDPDADPNDDPDPLITAPLYGQWHALTKRLLKDRDGTQLSPLDNWVHDLNLDPRYRVPAGFGTGVVQTNQEQYMDAAWGQIGDVLEANRRIRWAQFAREAGIIWHTKHLVPLQQASMEKAFTLTAPVHRRVMAGNVTAYHQLNTSIVPPVLTSTVMRRAIRPRGRLMRSVTFNGTIRPDNLLTRINDGEIDAAPPKVTPPGLPTVEDAADHLAPHDVPPLVEDALRRFPWWRPVILALIVLLVLLMCIVVCIPISLVLIPLLILLYFRLAAWERTLQPAGTLRGNGQTPDAVDRMPKSPDFKITHLGDSFTPKSGMTDSREAIRFKRSLKDVNSLLVASDQIGIPPTRGTVDLPGLAGQVVASIDPTVTVPRRVLGTIFLPGWISSQLFETFTEAMAYPEFDFPMYKPLVDISSEMFLPNIQLIEQNSITLLETNQKFIESYMVGLNHEFARELLWREYPTDQRGSYFRQFWDVTSFLNPDPNLDQDELREKLRDIPPLHLWSRFSRLGDHDYREQGGDKEEEVVLVIRGELLKKYPNAVIYAHRARWQPSNDDIDKTKERRLEELTPAEEANPPRDKVKTPLYQAQVAPDIYFFGFDLTAEEAKGDSGETPGDDPGWFFVIKERPGEPRFGLDIDQQPAINVWNDLSWEDVLPGAPGEHIAVSSNFTLVEPTQPDVQEKHVQWEEDRFVSWNANTNAADLAYILYQVPVLVAVHASEMLRPR
jgi:hypothetical protein